MFHFSSILYVFIKHCVIASKKDGLDIDMTRAVWKDGVNTGVITFDGIPHKVTIEPIKSSKIVEENFINQAEEIANS